MTTPAPGSKTKVAVGGVVIALASVGMVGKIRHDEGREYQPYRDIVGVLTVCDGITGPDVIPNKTYTDAECNALTIKHVEKHGSQLLDCIHVRITQDMYEGLNGAAYNFGVGAVCNGSIIQRINAGDYEGGCRAIMLYNKARDTSKPKVLNPRTGKMEHPLVPVRGLTLRREREMNQCLKGIPPRTTYKEIRYG